MAKKKPVKKAATKKSSARSAKAPVKKAAVKSKKATGKKPVDEKEKQLREANMIANSEKKKKARRPKKVATQEQTVGLLDAIVEGMRERKAKNITILNLNSIENRVSDYFVICDADSRTHVESIADSIEETVIKLTNEKPFHAEGYENGEWILIDYINIVAHVFQREVREHYNLEGLWGDAEFTHIND